MVLLEGTGGGTSTVPLVGSMKGDDSQRVLADVPAEVFDLDIRRSGVMLVRGPQLAIELIGQVKISVLVNTAGQNVPDRRQGGGDGYLRSVLPDGCRQMIR